MTTHMKQRRFSIYETIAASIVLGIFLSGYVTLSKSLHDMQTHFSVEARALMVADNVAERLGEGATEVAELERILKDELAKCNLDGRKRLTGRLVTVGDTSELIIFQGNTVIIRLEVGT